jgi:hypothetical protein
MDRRGVTAASSATTTGEVKGGMANGGPPPVGVSCSAWLGRRFGKLLELCVVLADDATKSASVFARSPDGGDRPPEQDKVGHGTPCDVVLQPRHEEESAGNDDPSAVQQRRTPPAGETGITIVAEDETLLIAEYNGFLLHGRWSQRLTAASSATTAGEVKRGMANSGWPPEGVSCSAWLGATVRPRADAPTPRDSPEGRTTKRRVETGRSRTPAGAEPSLNTKRSPRQTRESGLATGGIQSQHRAQATCEHEAATLERATLLTQAASRAPNGPKLSYDHWRGQAWNYKERRAARGR